MKVYSVPAEVPAPVVDYKNYNREKVVADEEAHMKALKEWLVQHGYKGRYTGEIYRVHVADGYAEYMYADGKKSCLIHLPYGDAYQSRDVQYLPVKVIKERIDADKRFRKLWDTKKDMQRNQL